MEKKRKADMTQLLMLITMVVGGGLILTEEQIGNIIQILLSAVNPSVSPVSYSSPVVTEASGIIAGYDALAAFLGFSVPTCVKMSKEGRFDAAVLDFGGGTRKKMWDRAKLIEIARKKNKR